MNERARLILRALLLVILIHSGAFASDTPSPHVYTSQHLDHPKFDGADLSHSRFDKADVTLGSFCRINLRDSNFSGGVFTLCVFTDADFRNSDLTAADFHDARLIGARGLGSCKLTNARFRVLIGANLADANLSDAALQQCDLYRAILARANLSGAQLMQANLAHADLGAADLRRANLTQADLRFANLRGVDLTGATLTNANAWGADLSDCTGLTTAMAADLLLSTDTRLPPGIELTQQQKYRPSDDEVFNIPLLGHVDLRKVPLMYRDLHGRTLHWAMLPHDIRGTNFSDCDMASIAAEQIQTIGANFRGAELGVGLLSRANFEGAIGLSPARFAMAYLDEAKLNGVNLEKSNFSAAYLSKAQLSGALLAGSNFRSASLIGANLTGADLTGADLSGADLTYADLTNARLKNVDLSHVFGLTEEQLKRAISYDAPRSARIAPEKTSHGAQAASEVKFIAEDGQEEMPPIVSKQMRACLAHLAWIALPAVVGLAIFRFVAAYLTAYVVATEQADTSPMDQAAASQPGSPFSGTLPKRRTGRFFLYLFPAIFIGVGGAIFYLGYLRTNRQAAASVNWTAVPCTIFASDITTYTSDDTESYKPSIQYAYEIGGHTYTGARLVFSDSTYHYYGSASVVMARFPVGSTGVCYVDPADPSNAVIRRSIGDYSGSLHTAGLLIFFGLAWIVVAFTNPRPSAQSLATINATRFSREEQATGHPNPPARAQPVVIHSLDVRLRKTVGLLAAMIIWAMVFLTVAVSTWSFRAHAGVTIAIGAVGFVGLLAFGLGLRNSFRRFFSPALRISFNRPLEPGRQVNVSWAFSGRSDQITALSMSLECTEHATYRQGTDTITDKNSIGAIIFARTTKPAEIREGKTSLPLPPNAMHTFTAKNNKLLWTVRVYGEIPNGMNIDDTIPILVYPHGSIA